MTHTTKKKRVTSRAVVYKDGKLLIMERWFRDKTGVLHHYYSIPGGGVEEGESGEQAVVRELMEEMSIEVNPTRLVTEQLQPDGCHHHYYWCEYISGEPSLQTDSEEALKQNPDNRFEPKWIPAEEVTPENVHFEYASFVIHLPEVIKNGGFMSSGH